MNPVRNLLFWLFLASCYLPGYVLRAENSPNHGNSQTASPFYQAGKSEFRGVWVATINNIDWPSRPGLPVSELKKEFLRLLDSFQNLNMNVVILQVRAASDAFYQSASEPWSYFLTGKQGKALPGNFDPLAWAIEMCHSRGMQLYAWLNPFRVRNAGYYALSPGSFAASHPQFTVNFDNKLFLDPGYPEVRSHLVRVVAELAEKYDPDAILMDDYFYPYPVAGRKFNDTKSYTRYGGNRYAGKLHEWRRHNIDQFIRGIHDTLKAVNPRTRFGISPFGIWRNKSADPAGSPGLKGISSYDDLHADVRKWLKEDWIDFVIPQLYWEKGNHFGDFNALVKWWNANSFGKSLYIGQALFKSAGEKNGWINPFEINEQINFLRTVENVRGFAFYSASNIRQLSTRQLAALSTNQLNEVASLENQHNGTDTGREPSSPSGETAAAKKDPGVLKKEFREFLVNQAAFPVSPADLLPAFRKVHRNRFLKWNPAVDLSGTTALVAVTDKRGMQISLKVLELSDSGEFVITPKVRRALRGAKLVMINRTWDGREDNWSALFQVKRSKITPAELAGK